MRAPIYFLFTQQLPYRSMRFRNNVSIIGLSTEERVMKRKYLWLTLLVGGLLVLLFLSEFMFTGNGRQYSSDLSQLRAQFNHDKGKVRLLLLLSPT
jgi:hypothetical protein